MSQNLLIHLLLLVAASQNSDAAITYTKISGTDSGPGGALRWKQCVSNCSCAHHGGSCPIPVLEDLCRSTPHCAGFNSNGWLKSCVSNSCAQTRVPSPGCDLYVGSAVAPGPWPPPPPPPRPGPAPGPWRPLPPAPTPPPAPPMPPVSPPAPVPPIDDWHFPFEEAAELGSVPQLHIHQIQATGNASGTLLLAEGSAPAQQLSIGESTASGWQLRAFIVGSAAVAGSPVAVLERDWPRWGALLFLQQGAASLGSCSLVAASGGCFLVRKGVGQTTVTRARL